MQRGGGRDCQLSIGVQNTSFSVSNRAFLVFAQTIDKLLEFRPGVDSKHSLFLVVIVIHRNPDPSKVREIDGAVVKQNVTVNDILGMTEDHMMFWKEGEVF